MVWVRCMCSGGRGRGTWSSSIAVWSSSRMSRPHHRGLNAPAVILLWARVPDIYEGWDKMNNLLKGIYMPRPFEFEEPIITNHLAIGHNYYTVSNVNDEEFGQWVRAHMEV